MTDSALDTSNHHDGLAATAAVILASIAYFATAGVSFRVLPQMVQDINDGGNTEIGFAFSALGLGLLIGRPFVGYLNDRFGRRSMVILGAIGAAVAQFAHVPAAEAGLIYLYAIRFVAGLFGSVMYVGLATIATEMPSPHRRAKVFGWFSASTFLGFALGPLVGEALVTRSGFTAAYLAAAAFAMSSAFAGLILPETRPHDVDPRLGGMRQMFDPTGLRVGLSSFVAIVAFMGFQGFLQPWGTELGVADVGPIISVYAVVALLWRAFGSRLLDANRMQVGTVALVLLGIASVVLAASQGTGSLIVAAVIMGTGSAFATPILLLIATDSTPAASRARVVSTVVFANDLGSSAAIPILGLIADRAGFPTMYVVLTVLVALSIAWFRRGMAHLPGMAGQRAVA